MSEAENVDDANERFINLKSQDSGRFPQTSRLKLNFNEANWGSRSWVKS